MDPIKKGKVYLVGAGPGDVGLLTLKGLRNLQRADVIVYDFHMNAQMLNYADRNAEFIYAGKRGGQHEMTQDQINAVLVASAQRGKTVCRLKGGDPFVFGRGGEEAEALADAGIDFEIIPGVSSSIAAPAYAGIPLTHRKYSSSFAVITGNEDVDKENSTLNWPHLAKSFDTLVFLMGVKNMGRIITKLLEHGKPAGTPAAIVRWGSRPDQKTVTGTLADIAEKAAAEKISPPAIMITGDVVRLRDKLKWYENRPLFGHRVLITRTYVPDYGPLEDLGAEIFEFATIKTMPPEDYAPLDSAIADAESYHWLVFTSANGFDYFVRRFIEKGRDIRDLKGIRICAIGPKTADSIKSFGLKIDLVPDEFNAEGLISAFLKDARTRQDKRYKTSNLEGLRILMPRAETAREIFPDRIRELGGEIDCPVAYRSVKPEKHNRRLFRFLKAGRITVATFTSAATFTNFMEIMGSEAADFLRDVAIAAIGPVTAKAIEAAGLKVTIIPPKATIEAMVHEIIKWAEKK
jgi:uroporphyrinogen III methyltransferase/synthase